VLVRALQWDGHNFIEVKQFTRGTAYLSTAGYTGLDDHEVLLIATLEGDMVASEGDFIIEGVHGEFYPCKPEIFDMTYEEVA
jgi:hypothetical protein